MIMMKRAAWLLHGLNPGPKYTRICLDMLQVDSIDVVVYSDLGYGFKLSYSCRRDATAKDLASYVTANRRGEA